MVHRRPCPAPRGRRRYSPELDEAAAIEKLWQLIFDVCRVTGGDPVSEWKAHLDRLTGLKDKMNALDLESVHFESSNGTDLTVGIADKAVWESAASVSEKGVVFLPNIPTEEVFTAPHKDRVNGIVYGTKPTSSTASSSRASMSPSRMAGSWSMVRRGR